MNDYIVEIFYDHEHDPQLGVDDQPSHRYTLAPDEYREPESPVSPGLLRKGSEVRIENSELTRPATVISPGRAVLWQVSSAKGVPAILNSTKHKVVDDQLWLELDSVEWPWIQPGCVEILFASAHLRPRDESYRRKWWDAYVTGAFQSWPAEILRPEADPMRSPDINDPGAAGTDRARMSVPGMARYASLRPSDTRASWPAFLTSLRAALRDHGRRAFHYRVHGKPWNAGEHGGSVGNYRSPGGITGTFDGVDREDRGGQWCADPMHGTIVASLVDAVEDRSEAAWLDATEFCQAMDSHLRTKLNGPVRPLRYYALPLQCVSQVGLVALGYKRDELPMIFDMFKRFITLIEAHVDESAKWLTSAPDMIPTVPLRNELRGDHMDVTAHVAEWLREQIGNDSLSDEELRKKARDEHWLDWFAFWMLGQLAHALASSIAFCEGLAEAGHPEAHDLLGRCKQLGRRAAEMATRYCLVKNNPKPNRSLEEGELPQPHWKGVFYKDNAPLANIVQTAKKDSGRGVFTSFGASGFAELSRYVAQDKCRAIVDAHLDWLNDVGWGNRKPDREAAGAFFHALEWRPLVDKG